MRARPSCRSSRRSSGGNLSTLHLARTGTDAALDVAREAADITVQIDGDTLWVEAMTALALARPAAGDQDGAAGDLHAAPAARRTLADRHGFGPLHRKVTDLVATVG
jgi:hypothetical protein